MRHAARDLAANRRAGLKLQPCAQPCERELGEDGEGERRKKQVRGPHRLGPRRLAALVQLAPQGGLPLRDGRQLAAVGAACGRATRRPPSPPGCQQEGEALRPSSSELVGADI